MITWIPAENTASNTIAYAILDQFQLAIFADQLKYGYQLFYEGMALITCDGLESVEEAKRAAFREYQRADATGLVLTVRTYGVYQDCFVAMDAQIVTNKGDLQIVTFWAEDSQESHQIHLLKPDQEWAIIDGLLEEAAIVENITLKPNQHYAILLSDGYLATGFTPHADLGESWGFVCIKNNLGVAEMLYYHMVKNEIIAESARP